MNKLFIVMLMLVIVPLANAQLYLTIDGHDDPSFDDMIVWREGRALTIDIYGDGGTAPNSFFMDIDGVFTWDISQATINYAGNHVDIQILTEDIGIHNPYIYFMLNDAPPSGPQLPLGPSPKPLIATILLTVGWDYELFYNTITLYDADLGFMNTYWVWPVPEPVTIALLGLGGLLLVRRKR